ncbi:flagellar hook-basal body complex subunit FliE [Alkaliphilus metalliredigens QYMF]|uniref:Flagellar hook-basal body complex protein FliE n=1 Tax=Alkaliphilus metalliredigens (strain QYMF) TaxID=293826 RepID=A6TRR0_ALKMQ|nr:flagellar hook-basal body complex protein FliE [Alkaliphilus metalliredigens]ABR48878.1 flagellar hook-basal body complex subunit FliE [Alkaliphilus metalliredigens QYMF]
MQVNSLLKIQNQNSIENLGLFQKESNNSQTTFNDLFKNAINEANILDQMAQNDSVKLATGELDNIHEAMITAQKADVSLQFIMQVRNKVLDAYREIMRMQI